MSNNLFETSGKSSRVEKIVCEIIRGIHHGSYAPGQRLVEAALTSELNTSRGPLREALRLLSAAGLVELIPNRGAVIRKMSREEIIHRFQLVDVMGAVAFRDYQPSSVEKTRLVSLIDETANDKDSILQSVMNFYSQLARSNNNAALAEMLARLNICHFSRHVLQVLKLDPREFWDDFRAAGHALLDGNRDDALAKHSAWINKVIASAF
ncbi:GntR family transcriptional regulator [Emcibacter sp.]|uniref:GntR family transcriptional regulator n=1 Tax=Emcibacter sp. TaxID=1979954 RepID=UPI002AA84605|nr:GntR family transcriptional regulator [Emcibacter sp.]